MQNIYSHDEIVAFVDGHLKKMCTGEMNDGKIAAEVVGWISQLPPLFQVLTVESRHDIVFADPRVMNRFFKEADQSLRWGVRGFYASGKKTFDDVSLNHPSFFHRGAHKGLDVVTATHEKIHDFDFMLGEWLRGKKKAFVPGEDMVVKKRAEFYSTVSEEWEWALERQVRKFSAGMKFRDKYLTDILDWSSEKLSKIFSRESAGESLYDNYRPMRDHLLLYDTKKTRLVEATAEMGAHYAMLYARTGGDECAIDLKLTARYPELWEEFRHDVLPRYEAMARDFLKARDEAIKDYVVRAVRMTDEYGIDARDRDFTREAAIAHAGGRMEEALEDIEKLSRFYENPVDNYVAALRDRDDLYCRGGDSRMAKADDAYQRGIAMSLLHAGGPVMLGEAYLDIEREASSFRKYLYAYDRIAPAAEKDGGAEKFFSFLYPASSASDTFRSLYRKGGGKAVDEHVFHVPSFEKAEALKEAAKKQKKLRCKIAGGPQISQETLERAAVNLLHETIKTQAYNEVERRKDLLLRENTLLRFYNHKVNELGDRVACYTGNWWKKPTGQEILDRYDAVKAKSRSQGKDGAEAVRNAIKNLSISKKDVGEYVSLRRIYDGLRRKEYGGDAASGSFMKAANDMAFAGFEEGDGDFLAKVAGEVMEMGFGGGIKAMNTCKILLRLRIADLKGNSAGVDKHPVRHGSVERGSRSASAASQQSPQP